MTTKLWAITLLLVLSCSLLSCNRHRNQDSAQIFPGLKSVKSIYIANLGNGEGAGLVREKLRAKLSQGGRFIIPEIIDQADAILAGEAGTHRSYYGTGGDLYTSTKGYAMLRLIDTKTTATIWSFEYRPRVTRNAVDHIADETVQRLFSDALRAEGTSAPSSP